MKAFLMEHVAKIISFIATATFAFCGYMLTEARASAPRAVDPVKQELQLLKADYIEHKKDSAEFQRMTDRRFEEQRLDSKEIYKAVMERKRSPRLEADAGE